MKKILMPILMIMFVVGGAVAADFIKTSKAETAQAGDTHEKSEEKKKGGTDKKGKSDSKKKKEKDNKKPGEAKGGDSGESGGADVNYLKFKRQFVVPVMDKGKIDALVIMNLNYELNSEATDSIYTFEPKLRDAIMRELLGLSRDGVFGEGLTSADSYEKIRDRLLAAGQAILPEGIKDVLILDIARQEQ